MKDRPPPEDKVRQDGAVGHSVSTLFVDLNQAVSQGLDQATGERRLGGFRLP